MSPFHTFLEEFTGVQKLKEQTTWDKKTHVVLVDGTAYMFYRPVTQSPEDCERLKQVVSFLTRLPVDRLRAGTVRTVDTKEKTIIAEFENLYCPTLHGRMTRVVLSELHVMWLINE